MARHLTKSTPCIRHGLVLLWAVPAGLVCPARLVSVGYAASVTHTLTPYSRGEMKYRWRDIADATYSSAFRKAFRYREGQVTVTYSDPAAPTLRGKLVAHGLKPNFAYQIKLEGRPTGPRPLREDRLADPANWSNQQIGSVGRWWCLEDDWNTWEYYGVSSYHEGHTLLGYLLFDFFVTDGQGNAAVEFSVDSSFHVLWKTSQFPPGSTDGRPRTFLVRGTSSYGYPKAVKPVRVSIYAEHEYGRPVPGQLRLPPGKYACRLLLTEESFHSYSWGKDADLGGHWAHCLSDENLEFTLLPSNDKGRE